MTPDADVASKLVTASVFTALNTDLFVGTELSRITTPYPDACGFVFSNGGPAPVPYIGTAKTSIYRAKVTIIVRGTPQDYATARTKCRTVITTLHLAELTGYVSCYAQESEPVWLGYDNNSRPGFAANVVLTREQ